MKLNKQAQHQQLCTTLGFNRTNQSHHHPCHHGQIINHQHRTNHRTNTAPMHHRATSHTNSRTSDHNTGRTPNGSPNRTEFNNYSEKHHLDRHSNDHATITLTNKNIQILSVDSARLINKWIKTQLI